MNLKEAKKPEKDLVRPNEKKEKNSYQPPKITDDSIRKAAQEADRHDKAQSKAIEDAHKKAMEILANKKKAEPSKPVAKPVEDSKKEVKPTEVPKVEPVKKPTKKKVTTPVENAPKTVEPSKAVKPKKVVTKPVEETPKPSKKSEIIQKAITKKKSVNPSEIKSKSVDDITNNFKAERAKERQQALDNMKNEKARKEAKANKRVNFNRQSFIKTSGKVRPVTKDNVSKVTMDAQYKPSKPSDSISHVSMPAHYVPKSARKSNASELIMPAYYTPKSEKKSHTKFKDFVKKGVEKAKEVGSEIKKRTIRDIPKLQNAYNKTKEKIGDAAFNAKFEYDWQKEKLKNYIDKKKSEKQSKVSDNSSKKVEEPKKSSDNNTEGSNASGYKPYHVAINHESKKYYRGKVVGTDNNLERHTFMARDKNHALDQAHEHAINSNLQKYKIHSVHDDSGVRLSNNYEFNKKKDSNTPSQESPNKEYVVRVKRNKGIFNKKEVVTPTRVSAKNAEEANAKALDAVKKEKGGRKHSVEGTYEKGKERTYSVSLQHMHNGLLGRRMKSSTIQVNHTNEQGAIEDAEKKYRKQYNVKPDQKVRITNTYRNAS